MLDHDLFSNTSNTMFVSESMLVITYHVAHFQECDWSLLNNLSMALHATEVYDTTYFDSKNIKL